MMLVTGSEQQNMYAAYIHAVQWGSYTKVSCVLNCTTRLLGKHIQLLAGSGPENMLLFISQSLSAGILVF